MNVKTMNSKRINAVETEINNKKQGAIECLAREYHEACREMVNNQIGMITKPTQPYLEWDELTEAQKGGRRFIAKYFLDRYTFIKKT